jgi:uncharacterized protein (UPF0212 family)
MYNSDKVKKWRKNTKQRMVDSMGGKCQCCGYNKCNDSLDFHHINPKEKEFGFAKIMANPKSWEKIANELRKCILVCKNCHGEIHAGVRELPEEYAKFDEDYLDYKTLDTEKSYCPVCGKEKKSINKTCSYACAAKLSGKVDWDKFDLEDLILEQKLSYSEIGRRLNVSDNAVRKRAKKIGIIPV